MIKAQDFKDKWLSIPCLRKYNFLNRWWKSAFTELQTFFGGDSWSEYSLHFISPSPTQVTTSSWHVQPAQLTRISSGCHIHFYSFPLCCHSLSCQSSCKVNIANRLCQQLFSVTYLWIDMNEVCVNAYQQTVREQRPCRSVIVISIGLAHEIWQRGIQAGAKRAPDLLSERLSGPRHCRRGAIQQGTQNVSRKDSGNSGVRWVMNQSLRVRRAVQEQAAHRGWMVKCCHTNCKNTETAG